MEVLQGSIEQARCSSGTPARPRRKKGAATKAPPKQARTTAKGRGRGAAKKSELHELSKGELYQRTTAQGISGRSK